MRRGIKLVIIFIITTNIFLLFIFLLDNFPTLFKKEVISKVDQAVFALPDDMSGENNQIVDIIKKGERVKLINHLGLKEWEQDEVELANGKRGYIVSVYTEDAPGMLTCFYNLLTK